MQGFGDFCCKDVGKARKGLEQRSRNQKVRLVEKLCKVLQIKRLRLAKTKIMHKKQGVDG